MENESGEGKNLAVLRRELFEKRVSVEIANLKNHESKEFTIDINEKQVLPLTLVKDGKSIFINFNGNELARYENGLFIYNLEYMTFSHNSYSIDLDSLQLLAMGESRKKDEKEGTDERTDKQDDNEKTDGEKNEQTKDEQDLGDKLKDEIAENYGLDEEQRDNIIELRKNRKITEKHKLAGLIHELDKYERVFLVPGEDNNEYSYKVIGITPEGKKEDVTALKQTEGNNPMQKIVSIDSNNSNNMVEGTAVAMFKRNNREGIAITRGPYNQKIVTYYRRMEVPMPEGGTDEMYITIPLPQQNTRNTNPPTTEQSKKLMDRQKTSEDQLEASMERFFILRRLEKQNIPTEIDPTKDGIQVEEVTEVKFDKIRDMMIEGITRELNEENQGHPDNRRNMATNIVRLVLDEGMDYYDAKDEALERRNHNDNEKNTHNHDHVHKLGGVSF